MLTSELMLKHFLIMESLPRRIYWFSSIILVISIMVISMAMDSIPGLPTDVFGWFLDTTLGSPLPIFLNLRYIPEILGGDPTCGEILSKFSALWRNTFCPKSGIFSKFSRYIYTQHPKNHFLLHFY